MAQGEFFESKGFETVRMNDRFKVQGLKPGALNLLGQTDRIQPCTAPHLGELGRRERRQDVLGRALEVVVQAQNKKKQVSS